MATSAEHMDLAGLLDDAAWLRSPRGVIRKRSMPLTGSPPESTYPYPELGRGGSCPARLSHPKAQRLSDAACRSLLQRLESPAPMGEDSLLCEEEPLELASSSAASPSPPPREVSSGSEGPAPPFARKMSRVASLNQWMGRGSSSSSSLAGSFKEEPEVRTPNKREAGPNLRKRTPSAADRDGLEALEELSAASDSDDAMSEDERDAAGEANSRNEFVERLYTSFCAAGGSAPAAPGAANAESMVAFGRLVACRMHAAQAQAEGLAPAAPAPQQPPRTRSPLQKRGSFSFF